MLIKSCRRDRKSENLCQDSLFNDEITMFPILIEANLVEKLELKNDYNIEFYSKIICESSIEYLYAITLKKQGKTIMMVTSEKNNYSDLTNGSHFLCQIERFSHSNYGDSNDYANPEIFAAQAAAIIKKKVTELENEEIVFKNAVNPGLDIGHL